VPHLLPDMGRKLPKMEQMMNISISKN